jgi:uncharacterized GH25 family protein
MKTWNSALLALFLAVLPARAHFIWIVPDKVGDSSTTARVFFSDNLKPDNPELLAKIARTELFVRTAAGQNEALKWTAGKEAYEVTLTGKGPQVIGGVCHYGVVERDGTTFLLNYYPKAVIGVAGKEKQPAGLKALDGLPLQIVPLATSGVFQLVWDGKPLPEAEVVVLVPGKEKPAELKTDKEGGFSVPAGKGGLYGLRARHVEEKAGEQDGKKYKEVRHYATLVMELPAASASPTPGAAIDEVKADQAATVLLADARAARAIWENFPGFNADLEANVEGKVTRGHVEVSPKGKVELKLDDQNEEAWVKRELGSVVGHRLADSAALATPCAFLDDVKVHPLGRAIRVLNDEFHSSYRVRDRQIIVVNREVPDAHFTITVMANQVNEERKFLPLCYVVNTWDAKTEALQSSQTYHQTWQRVGKYDLPATVTAVTASGGKLETRSLKLSNFKLH